MADDNLPNRTFTHPDVFTRGIAEGWADPRPDPRDLTADEWTQRIDEAWIPFTLVDGRPVNPREQTNIRYGRNLLGHWAEQKCADALVAAHDEHGHRRIVMIDRRDRAGWALPGGYVDPGETALDAAVRELREEAGLVLPMATWRVSPPLYVRDPRASCESWMVTKVARTDLGTYTTLPTLTPSDDAAQAAWIPADSYLALVTHLRAVHGGELFPAHRELLAAALS
ncbi:NUDIX hydrolase [Micromonospora haikouensis]|uniref:NUDIX hydrolase n=1 Tax=Micromonospora haikouensis TaxID=686309 RepID=UPI003D70F8B6